ncbi:hypothetical protein [Nodularia sphaerocarpa]|uniref:hypothetical protein n=1 Tax=Nodularia sphaerocarpa TaxID=137816 RepID=UPI001EFBEF97|nr:hypothetical protein [Nodularia sphaerocarpa]MDB9375638.1 hypothetical protein [Nodularia sphaerocarpa CS-585]MDB9376405.1 hypothetical protein [Nodularia sphaerocarpa CS-585A2]ULP74029.1 hypothetical protein BDGGKGIB_03689 [Nodularia sphaerocarpa UHCC 0038]
MPYFGYYQLPLSGQYLKSSSNLFSKKINNAHVWLTLGKKLLISGVILAANVILAPRALAACTFEEFNSGELVSVGSPLATSLVSSGESGSSSVEVAVNCNLLGGQLIVLPPIQNEGNLTVPALATVTNLSNGQATNSITSVPLIFVQGRTVLKVDMSVNNVVPLKAGAYKYTVRLQFTP